MRALSWPTRAAVAVGFCLLLLVETPVARQSRTKKAGGNTKAQAKQEATALINAGVQLGKEGRMPEAIASMERAVSTSPKLPDAHYNLGIGLDRARRSAEAAASFRTALALNPALPKPMALTVYEQLEAEQAAQRNGGGGEPQCSADPDAAGCPAPGDLQLSPSVSETQYAVVPELASAAQCLKLSSITAGAGEPSEVASLPVFEYLAEPTPKIHEVYQKYNRSAWEVHRRSFQWYYQLADAAVVKANADTWGTAFSNLVGQSMLQYIHEYTEEPLSRGTILEGWWSSTDYNTTFHKGMLNLVKTLLQVSPDEDCGGGLAVEMLPPAAAAGGTGEAGAAAAVTTVRLSQGDLLAMPAYAFSRVAPLPAGHRCRVVEAKYVGTDRGSQTFRAAGVSLALRTAAALHPARSPQLRAVLADNATNLPLLVQAVNGRLLPQLTVGKGFLKRPVPPDLFEAVLKHYETFRAEGAVDETVAGLAMHGTPQVRTKALPFPCVSTVFLSKTVSFLAVLHNTQLIAPLVDDTPELLALVQQRIQPVLERWVGRALVLQRCHGIRECHRGGFLKRHVDWPLSHVVAVIVNVAQIAVDEPWPLMIEDHTGLEHQLTMAPGEMVLYESARLVHGRPVPLNGSVYANLFGAVLQAIQATQDILVLVPSVLPSFIPSFLLPFRWLSFCGSLPVVPLRSQQTSCCLQCTSSRRRTGKWSG
eukprot:SAG22_NODE_1015_length_6025_cov_3.431320_6_plen_705_part_00